MKLLSKTGEDRYQSAYGLKADLEQAAIQLQIKGSIDLFTLGQQDFSHQFHWVLSILEGELTRQQFIENDT